METNIEKVPVEPRDRREIEQEIDAVSEAIRNETDENQRALLSDHRNSLYKELEVFAS